MPREAEVLDIADPSPDSLFQTIKVNLSSRQLEKLSVIDCEDYQPVAKKVEREFQRQGYSPTERYITGGILALKQYYAICFLDPNAHAVSDLVDPFWHAHILHTKQYVRFSDELIGKYMHHYPHDPENEQQLRDLRTIYEHTQRAYRRVYSYICPTFDPEVLPDYRLVCVHYNDEAFMAGDMFFPIVEEVEQAKLSFLAKIASPMSMDPILSCS